MRRLFLLLLAAAALLSAPSAPLYSSSELGRSIAINKLVTPNGDHRNDFFIFRCYNPRDAAIDARIYDLAGREVATMTLKQRWHGVVIDNISGEYYDLTWDPNRGGRKPGGVYIYQIRIETSVLKGTVTVIR